MKFDVITSEFERTVADLFDSYLAGQGHDPKELELAKKHHALPIGFDFLGWILLKPNGQLVCVSVIDD